MGGFLILLLYFLFSNSIYFFVVSYQKLKKKKNLGTKDMMKNKTVALCELDLSGMIDEGLFQDCCFVCIKIFQG